MSQWYEPKLKDIELSDDLKDIQVFLGSDDGGNIYASIKVEDIKQLLPQAIELDTWEKADKIVCSEMDKTELNTNLEFVACDDLVIKILQQFRAKIRELKGQTK